MQIFAAETGAGMSSYQLILLLSVTIILGLFAGRFFERKRIPNLSAYIIIGLIFGVLLVLMGFENIVGGLEVIINIGIGFIAFSIGLELDFKKIKKRTREVIIVTLFQAVFAFLVTFIALYLLLLPLHIALVVGSLAIATEPGPILIITKKLHAKGPLTDTLVPLHGVEDSITIMIFGIALSYAVSVEKGSPFGFMEILKGPIFEIIFSLLIGLLIGYILVRIIRYLKYEDAEKDVVILVSSLVAILASIAIANQGLHVFGQHIHLSPILLPMATGIFFSNMSTNLAKHETERIMDLFSAPILIVFFTALGEEIVILFALSVKSLDVWLMFGIAIVYVIARVIGKLSGSFVGGVVAKSSKSVRKYLGFCLLPQAQAAIGLAFYARSSLVGTPYGTMILIAIMISVLVNGLIGPLGVRHALLSCHGLEGNSCTMVQFSKIDPEKHNH